MCATVILKQGQHVLAMAGGETFEVVYVDHCSRQRIADPLQVVLGGKETRRVSWSSYRLLGNKTRHDHNLWGNVECRARHTRRVLRQRRAPLKTFVFCDVNCRNGVADLVVALTIWIKLANAANAKACSMFCKKLEVGHVYAYLRTHNGYACIVTNESVGKLSRKSAKGKVLNFRACRS